MKKPVIRRSIPKRLMALMDASAWLLILPALVVLALIDQSLAKTLVQWALFALVLAGVTVMVSRIVFPQIDLTALDEQAKSPKANVASAVIAAAVVIFVGMMFIGLVLWAKT